MSSQTHYALSITQAAKTYGIPRALLTAMIDRGELEADTSRPGCVLIPRREMERKFVSTAPPVVAVGDVKTALEEIVRSIVREEIRRAFSGVGGNR